jgi:hypothetical protein
MKGGYSQGRKKDTSHLREISKLLLYDAVNDSADESRKGGGVPSFFRLRWKKKIMTCLVPFLYSHWGGGSELTKYRRGWRKEVLTQKTEKAGLFCRTFHANFVLRAVMYSTCQQVLLEVGRGI